MEYEERNALAGLVSTLVVVIYFGCRLSLAQRSGVFNGPEGVMIWAQSVLWMLPVAVVICIALVILVNILNGMVTGDGFSFVTDERDHAIGRRGMQVTLIVASIVFLLAIAAFAAGWSVIAGLNIILAGFVAGDLAGNATKLWLYRSGH